MDTKEAMMKVAAEYAKEFGYKEQKQTGLYFNKCVYKSTLSADEMKGLSYIPEIWINNYHGVPRLNIRTVDGSYANVVYTDRKLSEAQAFEAKGLELAMDMKMRIDKLLSTD